MQRDPRQRKTVGGHQDSINVELLPPRTCMKSLGIIVSMYVDGQVWVGRDSTGTHRPWPILYAVQDAAMHKGARLEGDRRKTSAHPRIWK